jgi:methionyl-tRNA formyltransferase
MGIKRNILLVSTLNAELSTIIVKYRNDLIIKISNDVDEIKTFCHSSLENKILVSYNTNIIISKDDFEKCESSFNIHAASPNFPGRDPHHWAKYVGATKYGATLHYMTDKVDNGPIIKVNWFSIDSNDTPSNILQKANFEAVKLLDYILSALSKFAEIQVDASEQWNTKKYKRADLVKICDVTDLIDTSEFDLRVNSFYTEKHPNLYLKKFDQTFYLKLS